MTVISDDVARRIAAARARLLAPSPADGRFQPPHEPPLPEHFAAFRDHQWAAIRTVKDAFADGASVVFLQAPVGSGKTLVAEADRRLLDAWGLYVCSTKTLQDQMAGDFPYGAVLKGRANYETLSGPVTVDTWGRKRASGFDDIITCADCTKSGDNPCKWCNPSWECPYRVARDYAAASRLAVLNTSYLLTDANKGRRRFCGRDLTVVDEADLLEDELLGHIEVKITEWRMKRLKINPPRYKTLDPRRGRTEAEAWLPWVQGEAIPKVQARLRSLPPPAQASTPQLRERNGLTELHERLVDLAAELPLGGWVYDGYDRGNVIFRPVEVGRWGSRILWPHSKRWLLMSGTIISADQMADDLGLAEAGLDYRFIDVPMTFPVENRPIFVVPVTQVTGKNERESWPKLAEALAGVLALHPDDRILVHAVSHRRAEFLADELRRRWPRRPIVTYAKASERAGALQRYKETPGAVLVAASMDRGIDLPGDLCRVIVVCKVPYPNTLDKRVSARLYSTKTGQGWYAVQAVRSLVQMTGRGVRSEDDHCISYILDHAFTANLYRKHKALLPAWWREAIQWGFPAHRLTRAAARQSQIYLT